MVQPSDPEPFNLIAKDVGGRSRTSRKVRRRGTDGKGQGRIDRLETSEQEVHADDGRCLMLRVTPYRTRMIESPGRWVHLSTFPT